MVGVDQADYRQFPHWFAVAWFSQVGAIWWDSAHVEGSYWDSRCASPWCSRGMSLRSASFAPQWARPYLHLAFRSLPSFRHSWYRGFLCWHRFSSSFERVKPHIKPPAGLASGKHETWKATDFDHFLFLQQPLPAYATAQMTWWLDPQVFRRLAGPWSPLVVMSLESPLQGAARPWPSWYPLWIGWCSCLLGDGLPRPAQVCWSWHPRENWQTTGICLTDPIPSY